MFTIAIVDDAEVNLTLFSTLVRKLWDCEPVLFSDPVEGLAWCSENKPDIVIVDYMMPKLDGIRFIAQLRKVPGREDLPILMITANVEKDVRYEALESGATDFLTKPLDRIEFSARVRNMLALATGRKRLADRAAWLAEEVEKATAAVHRGEQELLYRMSRAAECRDPETGAHIRRMAEYSRLIAEQLGLVEAEQRMILHAAPMHDIGKIGIPDQVLLKPGTLTAEEFEIMKTHTTIGYDLLKGSDSAVVRAAATITYTHHERFNGKGYPRGLKGDEIPLYGRIVAVADVFDALTSIRPYKRAWTTDEALDYLHTGRGDHFDPVCVDAFLARWAEVMKIYATHRDGEPTPD